MGGRSPGWGWVAVGLGLALLLFAHGVQRPGAPLYDGLPLPQPPYRYVSPPPNLQSSNEPPLSGERTLAIRNTQVAAGTVATGDNQATAFFPTGALSVPPDSQGVVVRLEPDRNPPAPPPGSSIRGNVYRITALAQPSRTPAGVVRPFQVTLRYPPGSFQEIQLYREQAWHPLKTSRDASNPYATALLSELGELAATAPQEARAPSFFSVLARIVEGYAVLALVLAFGLIAVMQAIRRARKRA